MSQKRTWWLVGATSGLGWVVQVWDCQGGGASEGETTLGKARREKTFEGRGKAGWTEARVTDLVTLGRFWTRASGGGW